MESGLQGRFVFEDGSGRVVLSGGENIVVRLVSGNGADDCIGGGAWAFRTVSMKVFGILRGPQMGVLSWSS